MAHLRHVVAQANDVAAHWKSFDGSFEICSGSF